ncbi:MAG: wax ester/triacylglycerol synthase family O-acyltransferase [Solirubrobacteraceae bacterium]
MAQGHRISSVDTSFLAREKAGLRLHVASVTIFDGPAPSWDELREHVQARLHLVPRFRRRLAEVPLEQGRPVWVDDPHFNLRYHLRHAGLPAPAGDEQLKELAGRLFAQPLDRTKPLWEMWLVDRVGGAGAFALIAKSHHALVDGISAVDITSVLFDSQPDAPPAPAAQSTWVPRPLPTPAQLLSEALLERLTAPGELARSARSMLDVPRRFADRARERLQAAGALTFAGLSPLAPSPLNVDVGPHRRYTWVDAELSELRAIKDALGGSVNDAVLAVVAGALGHYLRQRGVDTRDLVLRALVPIAVPADVDHAALGNEVAPLMAPLPLGIEDPVAQFHAIREAICGLDGARDALGARTLTGLAGLASPTIMSQAARLQQSQPGFDLMVTNVPGPQLPLYLLGRRLRALYPVVPITGQQALGIALTSYDGRLGFGLLADYEALADLDVLAIQLRVSIDALAAGASISRRAARGDRRAAAHPSGPSPA